MTSPLYIGMGPGYVMRFRVAAGPDFDPVVAAVATSVVVLVTKPSGAEAQWAASVEASSADELTLLHELAVGDLDERGAYACSAHFTLVSGNVLRTLVGKTPPILGKNQPSA